MNKIMMVYLLFIKKLHAFKVIFILFLLHALPIYAAENAELNKLVESLRYEKFVKNAVTEVNNYQLQKRIDAATAPNSSNTKEKQEQRVQVVSEIAKVIENLLTWEKIEQPTLQVLGKELSKEEITTISAFLQTTAGQHYVNEFQYAAAPMAIALDKFVDQLVDQFIDEPYEPLPIISALDANETLASRLLIKLGSKDAAVTFEKNRAPFIAMMATSTKPKTNSKEDIEKHKKAMLGLNKAYSFEQINWRYAQVLSKQMSTTHMAALLTAVENPKLNAALLKFNSANAKINEIIMKQVMNSEEFTKLLLKL
jgi:hypothetical protein